MDIWHNPLAEMYGPYFLALYFVVVVFAFVYAKKKVAAIDDSQNERSFPIPQNADPYEIAFLRGGVNEVVRVAVFKLLKVGYLEITPGDGAKVNPRSQQIVRNTSVPITIPLDDIESHLIKFLETPYTSEQLFASSSLLKPIEQLCENYRYNLLREKMLAPADWQAKRKSVVSPSVAIIDCLALYKLTAAIHNGYDNVGFLVLLSVVGTVVLLLGTRLPRLTHRGQRYLRDLKLIYGGFATAPPTPKYPFDNVGVDQVPLINVMVLPLAIAGMSAISPTTDTQFRQIFGKASASSIYSSGYSGTGCGSGVGSSGGGCGGSGGCGGGGGGCGGCGGGG